MIDVNIGNQIPTYALVNLQLFHGSVGTVTQAYIVAHWPNLAEDYLYITRQFVNIDGYERLYIYDYPQEATTIDLETGGFSDNYLAPLFSDDIYSGFNIVLPSQGTSQIFVKIIDHENEPYGNFIGFEYNTIDVSMAEFTFAKVESNLLDTF